MIRPCVPEDTEEIYRIINDAAQAYKGVIPDDRYREPYMGIEELSEEIADGVVFWAYEESNRLIGVMGIQDRGEVSLIRHAYVRTTARNGGVGTKLLNHLRSLTGKPILIGTWKSAEWAIRFYVKNGFHLVSPEQKTALLNRYWDIPERQIETSVVLSNSVREGEAMTIARAEKSDLPEILDLQYAAYQSEAAIYDDYEIQPLKQTLEELAKEQEDWVIFKASLDGRIIGSVRVLLEDRQGTIGKLIVHPEFQNRGVGKQLMKSVEESFPDLRRIELFTGHKSERNIQFYRKLGYEIFKEEKINDHLSLVFFRKEIREK